MLDYEACVQARSEATTKKKTSYNRWSDKDRFQIGKYASIHGSSAAAKKFSPKEKPLNESSARQFSALYKEELEKAKINRGIQGKN